MAPRRAAVPIEQLIAEGKFIVGNRIGPIYGPLLGMARGTHLRKAIKELCTAGAIETQSGRGGRKRGMVTGGQGDLQHMTIKPAATK